ncbi:MAG TPA: acyltransferase domain-containing protein, partial [Saprospiraceae bacterium]|nr:acyltransferase domain-containing protein [Saprospiraceae bacterium]
KSPSYALDFNILQKAEQDFEDAIYIQLVRHPYAMIRSFEKMHMEQVMYLQQHPYNARQIGELIWTKSHQNINRFLQQIPAHRQFRLSYEDLVRQPEQMMRALCEKLGLDFHASLIHPYQDIEQKMTDGIYAHSKAMGDPKLLQHKKIDPKIADAWKGVLTDNFLSQTTWQLATHFSYPLIEDEKENKGATENPNENPANSNSTHSTKLSLRKEIPPLTSWEKSGQKLQSGKYPSTDIAIIGMSGRFPGARNLKEFWQNLEEGKDVSKVFTTEELRDAGISPQLFHSPDYVNRGMPLADADCFDASFFGYLPKEAALMDPQHRIFLELAYAALEDAAYDPSRFKGEIGVFGGTARNTYLINNVLTHPNYFKSLDDFQIGVSLEKDFPATKVAYKLKLNGPAVNVQTACSSSGVAVHLACQSLLLGDADILIVGGGRIQPPVNAGHKHTDGHALSPDGYCRTFDADAKGMVRGNGMAMIVLKRLDQAIADGDTIHAIIKATAVGNDGGDKVGFTAPSVLGQSKTIVKAYQKAAINPETVQYIEAHGTGTILGDPIEVAALTKAFQQFTDKKGFCGIGSVKTNIGHLDAGACVAGIIKTVLALKHEKLPASLHFKKPNPQIDFEHSPFFVQHQLKEWKRGDIVRRAGVSSFGLGGTNVHIILEEAPVQAKQKIEQSHHLLVLSAKKETALLKSAANLAEFITNNPQVLLANIAHTLQVGRIPYKHRMFLVVNSKATAINALKTLKKSKVFSKELTQRKRQLVFMFPGGGAQHSNMGLDLYEQEPVFRNALDQCLHILKIQHDLDLREVLYPVQSVKLSEPILNPLHAITLLFSIEYATAQLLLSWGLIPKELIGHSLGEYTAACISGVMNLEDALALVTKRGLLFQELDEGTMLSVPLSEAELMPYMDNDLSFAAINKPDHCVVSGSMAAIDRIKQKLNKEEIHATRLHITVAAHSHMVEPILAKFEQFLNTIKFKPPQIPIVSNLTGKWADEAEIQSPKYWLRHLRHTVRFSDGIQTLLELERRVLLEVGPGQSLSTFARQHPVKKKGQLIFASLRHPKEQIPDLAFLLKTLGNLWLAGIDIHWQNLHAHHHLKRISLPGYPFEKQRHWIAPKTIQLTSQNLLDSSNNNLLPPQKKFEKTKQIEKTMIRKELIIKDLKEVFYDLSGMAPSEMDEQATFLELGFDSLFLTQSISKIKNKFKIKLSFRQLFEEAPTIDALGDFINKQLPQSAYQEALITHINNNTSTNTGELQT